MDWLQELSEEAKRLVEELLSKPMLEAKRRDFPESPGLYAISTKGADEGSFLRCGATINLKQRLYSNHLMGNQKGNLPRQLVREGACPNLKEAKKWIELNCVVRCIRVEGDPKGSWKEKAIEGLLRPKFMGVRD